ncbi:MAG: hypothetical protein RL026_1268 [Pseudomonadota bacterium]|jgi:type VI secretion system FHA domain protein
MAFRADYSRMNLRLEIISQQRERPGVRPVADFGPKGGRIGRAMDNDWPLPDPRRHLSAYHARVLHRAGEWWVEDLSSNGLFFGREREPIGQGGERRLQDGDTLRLGDYVLRTVLRKTAAEAQRQPAAAKKKAAAGKPFGVPDITEEGPLLDLDRMIREGTRARSPDVTQEALWPSLQIDELFRAEAARVAGICPRPTPQASLELAQAGATGAHGGPTPPKAAGNALAAFCRGAGIDPNLLPGEEADRMLTLAGRLLREAILGIQDLERAQGEFRRRHDLEHPEAGARQPALASRPAAEVMIRFLQSQQGLDPDPVLILRRMFGDATRQDLKLGPALQQALQVFMLYIAPGGIELRTRGRSEAERWALHCELYRTLVQAPDGQLPAMFLEALGQAWRGSGADR